MSGPGVGFEYPAQSVSWLKRDLLLFANSIGATADELHFLYVSSCKSGKHAICLDLGEQLKIDSRPTGTSPQLRRLSYLPRHPT